MKLKHTHGWLAALALGGLHLSGSPKADAAVTLHACEVDGDVVISGGGTLNLGAWTNGGQIGGNPSVLPSAGTVLVGPAGLLGLYVFPVNFISDGPFGAGGIGIFASSSDGDAIGINDSADWLGVPLNYVSGNPLSGSATWSGATFASLGMTPGTYVWSWGREATADSFTLHIGDCATVPEPSRAVIGLVGLMGAVVCHRRRRPGRE